MRSSSAPRPWATWAAVVGLTAPEGLADGAAMGPPNASSRSWATGSAGTRSATVSSPAQARSETGESAARASTSVSGPGQNASAKSFGARVEHGQALRAGARANMHNQGIEARPLLGGEDARHRMVVCRVRAQSIDCLGGERHESPRAQESPRRAGGTRPSA